VRDLFVLFLHLLATVARLAGPSGARSVVAESVLVKDQLLILDRSRKRSPVPTELHSRVRIDACGSPKTYRVVSNSSGHRNLLSHNASAVTSGCGGES
jgi:hypothetical protein